jgi:voltage-gated potassium channel
LRRFGPGDFFGETALITEEKRLAHVIAESDCFLLSLERHDFHYIFRDRPEIIDRMLHLSKSRV